MGQIKYLIDVWGMPPAVGTIATDGYTTIGADANYTKDEVVELFAAGLASMSPSAGQPAPSWCNTPWSVWATIGAYYGFFLHACVHPPRDEPQRAAQALPLPLTQRPRCRTPTQPIL